MKEILKSPTGFPTTCAQQQAFLVRPGLDKITLVVNMTTSIAAYQIAYTIQSADKTLQMIVANDPTKNTSMAAHLVFFSPMAYQDFIWDAASRVEHDSTIKTLVCLINDYFNVTELGEYVLHGS